MTRDMLIQIITKAEQWADTVEPYHEDLSDAKKAWHLGFAAAMQRVEIYGQQMIERK